jgi:hypothetical protein
MKKAVLSAILLAGLATTITSCNNGDYTATPEANNATVLNPLNPESGVTIPIGYIRADLNSYLADFTTGTWAEAGGVAVISSVRIDNNAQWQSMTITLNNFTGVGTYTIYPDGSSGTITHNLYDPASPNYIPLGYNSSTGDGMGIVNVEGVEDGNIRGTFSGTLYQYSDVVNTANKEVVANGKFYLAKAQ